MRWHVRKGGKRVRVVKWQGGGVPGFVQEGGTQGES